MSNPTATEEVFRRFGDDLRRFAARRVPAEDVDDVVQDIMLRVHGGLGDLREDRRLVGWIYRVARSAVVDHLRRRRPGLPLEAEPVAPVAEEPRAEAAEVASWLRPMMSGLSAEHREALTLVELEGISQSELATRLGLSPSGARTRVQRARAALREAVVKCCAVAVDARGGIIDYESRSDSCNC